MTSIIACGGGGQNASDAGGDATKDVAPFDAKFNVDAADMDAGPDVAALDAGPPCAPGDYHFEITNDAGTTMLTNGCGDASAPSITFDVNCMDCQNVSFSACGGGQMARGSWLTGNPIGTFNGVEIDLSDTDGGICQFNATVSIVDWPGDGGSVHGAYATTHTGGCTMNPAPISGRFCLKPQ